MADRDAVPEADELEQRQPAGAESEDPLPAALSEASEADAMDQAAEVVPGGRFTPVSMEREADEADLLDQAREVPVDEDDY